MNNPKNIPTLTTTFDLPLRPHQISQWRGAVAEAAGWENDRFHNHAPTQVVALNEPVSIQGQNAAQLTPDGSRVFPRDSRPPSAVSLKDKFLYRYPTIQYRAQKGHASIFAIGEGVADLRRWLLQKGSEIQINGRPRTLLIKNLQENTHTLRMLPQKKIYRLMDYQPFSQDNYQLWKQADDLIQRVQLLERILVGHIITFANGMDWRFTERLELSLLNIRETKTVRTHGTQRLAFNLIYKANIDLPPNIALGRAVSHGFGVNMPARSRRSQ